MSIQSEIERIRYNVQTTLQIMADAGVEVGENSDSLPAAATALANSSSGSKSDRITVDNINKYFDVVNEQYYFAGEGYVFTTNNGGVASSTARTTLTALVDMDVLFVYSYSSEASYDKFTLSVSGTTIENAVSGSTTTKFYSGTISAGSDIVFAYTKDSSQDKNDDRCTFSNMYITCI